MKSTIFATLSVLGFIVGVPSLAVSQAHSGSSPYNSGTTTLSAKTYGAPSGSRQNMMNSPSSSQSPDSNASANTDSAPILHGTIIALDPDMNMITITDYTTGRDRTFSAEKSDLKGLKTGDKVQVTPAKDNSSNAQKIEKDKS